MNTSLPHEGPPGNGPSNRGPSNRGPSNRGPSNRRPSNRGPSSSGPSSSGPPIHGQPSNARSAETLPAEGLSAEDLAVLVPIARRAIEHAVREGGRWRPDADRLPVSLRRNGSAFVTLHAGGRLRGCVGRMDAAAPLGATVAEVARSAALEDPRFRPVREHELDGVQVSVSVLTPAESMDVGSYDELLRAVRPGVDGLVVDSGRHRATLLPAVWENLPDVHDFLAALWRKAGLPPIAWPAGTVVSRYRAQEASEV